MLKNISITEVKNIIATLPKKLARRQGAVSITRYGKPVLAVMSWQFYESLMETLEILGDEETMASLRRGIKDMERGKFVSWEEVKKKLDL